MSAVDALFDTVSKGNLGGVQQIVSAVPGCQHALNERNESALFMATKRRQAKIAAYLVAAGADVVCASSFNKFTPIHYAARNNDFELVKSMLARVKNPRQAMAMQSSKGDSPLHVACFTASAALVGLLLQSGANMELKNGAGETALLVAARCNRPRIIDVLLRAGASQTARNNAGETARDTAAAHGFKEVLLLLPGPQSKTPLGLPERKGPRRSPSMRSSNPPVSPANFSTPVVSDDSKGTSRPTSRSMLPTNRTPGQRTPSYASPSQGGTAAPDEPVTQRDMLTREAFLGLVRRGSEGYAVRWHVPNGGTHEAQLRYERFHGKSLGRLMLEQEPRSVAVKVSEISQVISGLHPSRAAALGRESVRGVRSRQFLSIEVQRKLGSSLFFDLSFVDDAVPEVVALIHQASTVYSSPGGVDSLPTLESLTAKEDDKTDEKSQDNPKVSIQIRGGSSALRWLPPLSVRQQHQFRLENSLGSVANAVVFRRVFDKAPVHSKGQVKTGALVTALRAHSKVEELVEKPIGPEQYHEMNLFQVHNIEVPTYGEVLSQIAKESIQQPGISWHRFLEYFDKPRRTIEDTASIGQDDFALALSLLFRRMDQDNSGEVSVEEFRREMRNNPMVKRMLTMKSGPSWQPYVRSVSDVFAHVDSNASGELDWSEFVRYFATPDSITEMEGRLGNATQVRFFQQAFNAVAENGPANTSLFVRFMQQHPYFQSLANTPVGSSNFVGDGTTFAQAVQEMAQQAPHDVTWSDFLTIMTRHCPKLEPRMYQHPMRGAERNLGARLEYFRGLFRSLDRLRCGRVSVVDLVHALKSEEKAVEYGKERAGPSSRPFPLTFNHFFTFVEAFRGLDITWPEFVDLFAYNPSQPSPTVSKREAKTEKKHLLSETGRPEEQLDAVKALSAGFLITLLRSLPGGKTAFVPSYLHYNPDTGPNGALFLSSTSERREEAGRSLPWEKLGEVWRGKKDKVFAAPQAKVLSERVCMTLVTTDAMAVNMAFQRADDRQTAVDAIKMVSIALGKRLQNPGK